MISHMTSRSTSCRPPCHGPSTDRLPISYKMGEIRERNMNFLVPGLSPLRTRACVPRTFHKRASLPTLHRTFAMSPPEKKQRTEEYILYYVRLIWGSSSLADSGR